MIEALRKSFEGLTAALRECIFDAQRVRTILAFIEHNCEHYGQLVVYSRLAGIVPPASRGE